MSSPDQPFPRPAIGEREFVAMMALVQALQALAIDIMLPALGIISAELDAGDPNHRQLVVGVFLMGAGLGALVPGSLADRFGRRPVLLTSLALYILTAIVCILIRDFEGLIALRPA